MSNCPKCGKKAAEGDLYCSTCGTKVEQVEPTEEKAPVVPTEEPWVKAQLGKMGVAHWAIVSAIVGALCAVVAAPLAVMGLNHEYDLIRGQFLSGSWTMPPGTAIAAIVLTTVSIIFIALAIALGIYALCFAEEE